MYDDLVKKVNAIQTNNTSNLDKKADYNTKNDETEKEIPKHDKYITIQEFNKLISANV